MVRKNNEEVEKRQDKHASCTVSALVVTCDRSPSRYMEAHHSVSSLSLRRRSSLDSSVEKGGSLEGKVVQEETFSRTNHITTQQNYKK